jgi:hypothetical protein
VKNPETDQRTNRNQHTKAGDLEVADLEKYGIQMLMPLRDWRL